MTVLKFAILCVVAAARHLPAGAQNPSPLFIPPTGVIGDSGFVILRLQSSPVDSAESSFAVSLRAIAGLHNEHVTTIASPFQDSAAVRKHIYEDVVWPRFSSDRVLLMLLPAESASFVRIEGGPVRHADITWPAGTTFVSNDSTNSFTPETPNSQVKDSDVLFAVRLNEDGGMQLSVVMLNPGTYKGHSGFVSRSQFRSQTNGLTLETIAATSIPSGERSRILTIRESDSGTGEARSRRLLSFELRPLLIQGLIRFPVDNWIPLTRDVECQDGGVQFRTDRIELLPGTRVRHREGVR